MLRSCFVVVCALMLSVGCRHHRPGPVTLPTEPVVEHRTFELSNDVVQHVVEKVQAKIHPERGEPGQPGESGRAGAPGQDGKDGEKGLAGRLGLRGPRGPQGPAGSVGREGPKGPPGPQGAPADPVQWDLLVGRVHSLEQIVIALGIFIVIGVMGVLWILVANRKAAVDNAKASRLG